MFNVVVILVDFPQTNTFNSYKIFPKFQLEEKTLSFFGVEVFPRRLKNLLVVGYGIRTMPDEIFAYSFTYELDGCTHVGGYLQKLLQTFVTSINATLFHPFPVNVKYYDTITGSNMTHHNVLDIPIAGTYIRVAKKN